MDQLWNFFNTQHPALILYAWAFLRMCTGTIIALYGIPNLVGGYATWTFLGSAMQNFGISFFPAFWGFLAACVQFFGGASLILGTGTRFTSLFLIITMTVAFSMHMHNGDMFKTYAPALTLLILFIVFFIGGSGPLSYDAWRS